MRYSSRCSQLQTLSQWLLISTPKSIMIWPTMKWCLHICLVVGSQTMLCSCLHFMPLLPNLGSAKQSWTLCQFTDGIIMMGLCQPKPAALSKRSECMPHGPIYGIFQASLLGCLGFLLLSSFLYTNSAVSSLPMSFSSVCMVYYQCTCHSFLGELWRLPQRQRSSQSHILHASSFRVAFFVAIHQALCNLLPHIRHHATCDQ